MSRIAFINDKGHRITLPGGMKLSELVKRGITSIRLAPPDAPLLPGEYREEGLYRLRPEVTTEQLVAVGITRPHHSALRRHRFRIAELRPGFGRKKLPSVTVVSSKLSIPRWRIPLAYLRLDTSP